MNVLLWFVGVTMLALFPVLGNAAVSSVDSIVAVVDDDVILRSELDGFIDETVGRLRQQGKQLPPQAVLDRQLLERLILKRLQLALAERTGIRVDDTTLNNALRGIARQNGLTLGEFRDVLEREGTDFAAFREKVREEFIITRLRQREVNNRVVVSEQEVDSFLEQRGSALDDTSYRLGHVLIAVPGAASPDQVQQARVHAEKVLERLRGGADFAQVAIAESSGQQALEGGDLGWRTLGQMPTVFAEKVVKMEPGEFAGPFRSPAGFHIIKLMERKGSGRHVVIQTHARHILIKPDEITSVDEVRNKLEQLRLRIQGGDDFSVLARAHSQDRLSAAKGGDLGWTTPGELVPQFQEVMDGATIGEVSEPFETQFGWHILQVLERREHDSTREYVRAKAKEEISKRKTEEALELWLRNLRDDAYVEFRLENDY